MWSYESPKISAQDAAESIRRDLEQNPELNPFIDVDRDGKVVCFGWSSPIYDYPEA